MNFNELYEKQNFKIKISFILSLIFYFSVLFFLLIRADFHFEIPQNSAFNYIVVNEINFQNENLEPEILKTKAEILKPEIVENKISQKPKKVKISKKIGQNKSIKNENLQNSQNIATKPSSSELSQILSAINEHKIYPKKALKLNQSGVVTLKFLLQNGVVSEILITKSSGFKILDEAGINAIKNASSKFPQNAQKLEISLDLNFQIR